MKIKKIILGAAVAVAAVVGLASCGGSDKKKDDKATTTAQVTTTSTNKTTTAGNTNVSINFYDGDTLITTKNGQAGETIQIEDPTKEGKDFDGWYTDSTLTNKYTSTVFGSENMNLYAKFVQHFEPYNHRQGIGYYRADYKPVLYYEFEVVHDDGNFYIDMFSGDDYESPAFVKNVTIYSDKDMKNAIYTMEDFENRDMYGALVKYLTKSISIGKYYLVTEINDVEVDASEEIRFDVYYESDHGFDMYGKCNHTNCDEIQTEGYVNVEGLSYADTLTLAPGDSLKMVFDGSSLAGETMTLSIEGTKNNENNVTIDGYTYEGAYIIRGNFDNLPEMGPMELSKGKIILIFATQTWSTTTPTTITFSVTIR